MSQSGVAKKIVEVLAVATGPLDMCGATDVVEISARVAILRTSYRPIAMQ